ncbi:ATP-binding protein [Desulfobacterales bacterium HSG16]|nr:ATP-binding protein [Desulfobacterales bacterium HSG16]
MPNPFRDAIVTDPWKKMEIDIPRINADAFSLCLNALEDVLKEGQSSSVLLYGGPGSGKTHLLGRLREHLNQQPYLSVFVSIRLQTHPNMLWRHIRRCFVESLVKTVKNGKSQLELVCEKQLKTVRPKKPEFKRVKKRVPNSMMKALIKKSGFVEYLWDISGHVVPKYQAMLSKEITEEIPVNKPVQPPIEILCARLGISRNVCRTLKFILEKRHTLDAIAWLKGDSLPEKALNEMGLTQDDNMNSIEYQAAETVKELCKLAGSDICVVFCFDQVEALQRYPNDIRGLFSFGQAVGTLHDETKNTLMVSCIQSFFLEDLKKAITKPDYARLVPPRRQGTLNPLTLYQALDLVEARLSNGINDKEKIEEFFAILEERLDDFVGKSGKTARTVLSYCADLFYSFESGQLLEQVDTDNFLIAEKEAREKNIIETLTLERTDEIILRSLPVLVNALDENWKETDPDRISESDMILKGPDSSIAICLCNHVNMMSLSGYFKKLIGLIDTSGINEWILIRHSRLPISQRAVKTNEYLNKLKEKGARLIQPGPEALAELEVFQSLIADAKAGDLSNHALTVSEQAVCEWIREYFKKPALHFADDFIAPIFKKSLDTSK